MQLDELLQKAATEPEYRPEFLDRLLTASVYCFAVEPNQKQTDTFKALDVTNYQQLLLQKWENPNGSVAIPCFLSLEELKKSAQAPHSYAYLSTEQFFELAQGETVLINPMSSYGKVFSAEQIAHLLHIQQTQEQQKPQDEQVLCGQPSQYPQQLVNHLNEIFVQNPSIHSAYLAEVYPTQNSVPILSIGLIVSEDLTIEQIVSELDQKILQHVGLVDFFIINDEKLTTVGEYMREETQPFYQKQHKNIVSRLFSGKR